MDLSIVILNYNTRDHLRACLRSVVAALGDGPLQVEVLVVDNASSDGTADATCACFPSVELIRSDRNLGAAGRNLGVVRAGTELVAFADDDCWWEPRITPAVSVAAGCSFRHRGAVRAHRPRT